MHALYKDESTDTAAIIKHQIDSAEFASMQLLHASPNITIEVSIQQYANRRYANTEQTALLQMVITTCNSTDETAKQVHAKQEPR